MTDEQLAMELRKSSGKSPAHHPVAELLARHWEPVFEYAGLCTTGPQAAGMLTTAAFTRVFGEALRQTGPTAAWRPYLLTLVRGIAGEWDAGERRELVHPELRSRGRATVRPLPRDDRRLVFRAFQGLPEAASCLLWHRAVEAESLKVPAGLLGLGGEEARGELERARGLFREGCLRAHHDLAPGEECRQYGRLLDVSVQRGDTGLDPDLRRHMARCTHCRQAAGQLDHSGGRTSLLLAEAVLGWAARTYLDSRPGRRTATAATAPASAQAPTQAQPQTETQTPASAQAPAPLRTSAPLPPMAPMPGRVPDFTPVPPLVFGPRHSARAARRARLSRGRRLVKAALGIGACVLVPLLLWADPWSGGSGSSAGSAVAPDSSASPGIPPSQVTSGDRRADALHGRLRDAATGLCVDIAGGSPAPRAEAVVAKCTSAETQQWSYEPDGLLRSLAGSASLCLDSRRSFSIELGPCTASAKAGAMDVRYDFTLQGTLVPRWDQELAATPVSAKAGATLVLKPRDGSTLQRWLAETPGPSAQADSTAGSAFATPDSLLQVAATLPASASTPTPALTPTRSSSPSPSPSAKATATAAPAPSSACYYCYWGGSGPYYPSGSGGRGGR